jgi:hypothetical protein
MPGVTLASGGTGNEVGQTRTAAIFMATLITRPTDL